MSDEYTTIVIKHEKDSKCPPIFAGMQVLDGHVVAVQFNDALEELNRLEETIERLDSELGL